MTIVQKASDAAAQEVLAHYEAGTDRRAIAEMVKVFGGQTRDADRDRVERVEHSVCFAGRPVAGSARSIAHAILELALEGNDDGLMFVWPDYERGLRAFQANVAPILRADGLRVSVQWGEASGMALQAT